MELSHPGLLAPQVSNGQASAPSAAPVVPFWSDPGASVGPLSVLISRADHRAYVYRGGTQIGSAPVAFDNPGARTGVAAFSLLQKPSAEEIASDSPNLRWSTVQVSNPQAGLTPAEQLGKFTLDPYFLRELLGAMDIGSTLVITDLPSSRETRSNPDFTVMTTNERQTAESPIKK
ncbi:MAG: hypothetical protein GAK45_00072 [Pseudomonas citronellolis]|nr:MAG: hypothetical protein GAK45_00072 [Pseudomonas citronellolis]